MNFHPTRCYVLRVCRIKSLTIHYNTMLGQTLNAVDHKTYLGITISESLNWKTRILVVKNKANRTLGYIKGNLYSYPERVKSQVYTSLERPIIEYGCSAWNPYSIYQETWLEHV